MSGSASREASTAPRSISASPSRISSIAISPRASTSSTKRWIFRVSPRSTSATPAAISDSAFRFTTTRKWACGIDSNARKSSTWRTTRRSPSSNRRASPTSPASVTPLRTIREIYRNSPTSGIFTSFSQDLAGVGGDVNYFRSVVDTRGYYPITNKITLVGRAQGGSVTGWGGEDVRLTDLFFKGGETIRGFERAGYGPRDACENPITGRPRNELLARLPRWRVVLGHHRGGAFPLPIRPRQHRHAGRVFRRCRLSVGAGPACGERRQRGGKLHLRQRGSTLIHRISASSGNRRSAHSAPISRRLCSRQNFDKTEVFRFGASTNF